MPSDPRPQTQLIPEILATAANAEAAAAARVVDPDPLRRLLAEQAARAMGFSVRGEPHSCAAAVTFLGLDALASCPRLAHPEAHRPASPTPTWRSTRPVVGYVSGAPIILAAHRRHRCTDSVARLCVIDDHASFVCATEADVRGDERHGSVLPPDVTAREADVLLLVLCGLQTAQVAAQLDLSAATARSHCRSLLRKCAASDRHLLRARFLSD